MDPDPDLDQTKDRQKMKNIFNFQDRGVWFRFVPERLDPDPEKFEHRIRIRIHAKTPDPNPDLQPWPQIKSSNNISNK